MSGEGREEKKEKTKTLAVKPLGFLQEADGAYSLRRLLASLFAATAAFSLVHTTLVAGSGGLESARISVASLTILLGLTTGEGIAAIFKGKAHE